MVGRSHKHIFNIVFFDGLHSLNALAATMLCLEIIYSHTLNIAKVSNGNYGIFIRNQVFISEIVHVNADGSSSVIAVLVTNHTDFLLDNAKKYLFIRKNQLIFINLLHEFCILLLQTLSFQTGKSTETHIHDSLCLNIIKTEVFH